MTAALSPTPPPRHPPPPAAAGPLSPRSARSPGSRAARSAAMGRPAAPLRRLLLSLLLLPTAATGGRGAASAVEEPEAVEELMEYRDPCKAGRGAGGLQLREKFARTEVADRCPREALLGTPVPPGSGAQDHLAAAGAAPSRELPGHPAALPNPSGRPASCPAAARPAG